MVLLTSVDGYVQLITALLIFVFVLAVTAVVTRYIAGVQKGCSKGKNLDVIETVRVAQNKYLQIVRAGEHYLVIAICQDSVRMLCEITKEELVLQENGAEPDFSEVFKKFINKSRNPANAADEYKDDE